MGGLYNCVRSLLDKHKIMHDTTRTCCIPQPASIPWQVRGRKVAFQVYGLHKARTDSTSYTLVACLDRISCSNQNMRKKQIPLQYLHVTYILRPLSAFIRTWLSTRTGTAVPDFLLTYHSTCTCNIMLRLKTLIGHVTSGAQPDRKCAVRSKVLQ